MSEQPTPGVVEGTAEHRPQTLTPQAIEAILADFRAWLNEVAEKGLLPEPAPAAAETIDLHTLLGQFIALRHEVNLQTKAVRAQQEQNAQTLDLLRETLDRFHEPGEPVSDNQPSEELVRGQLKTLVELHDALSLASREVQRVREALLPNLDRLAAGPSACLPDEPKIEQSSFLSRLFRSNSEAALRAALNEERQRGEDARQAAQRIRTAVESLITGYTMSLQRLDRALRLHDLEPIPCVGTPFDPDRMEVLEVVPDSGRPSGQVLDEVRRGYLRHGRVFRHAQVRVVKSV
jgi:molecular chaperone GrpE